MTVEPHEPHVVAEIDKNQHAFDEIRQDMEGEHWGKTVLMHDGAVVAIYNDHGDAYTIGREKFGLGGFSLHLVGQQPVDLGFHAISLIPRN